jgi:hypothetical protein
VIVELLPEHRCSQSKAYYLEPGLFGQVAEDQACGLDGVVYHLIKSIPWAGYGTCETLYLESLAGATLQVRLEETPGWLQGVSE